MTGRWGKRIPLLPGYTNDSYRLGLIGNDNLRYSVSTFLAPVNVWCYHDRIYAAIVVPPREELPNLLLTTVVASYYHLPDTGTLRPLPSLIRGRRDVFRRCSDLARLSPILTAFVQPY